MSHSRRRVLALTVTIGLLLAALAPVGAAASSGPPMPRPTEAPSWVTDNTIDTNRFDSSRGAGASLSAPAPAVADDPAATAPVDPVVYDVGDVVPAVTIDTAFGALFADLYTVRAIGEHIEVWVQNDMSFFLDDPATARPTPVITDAQIAYVVDQFDNNIFPKESEFWRTPALRDGTNAILDDILGLDPDTFQSFDGQDRVIAKIENIEDENFYDPTFPLYVAGFFSPDVNFFMDRNVITIDAFAWDNRLGPNDSPWRPADGPDNDVEFLYEAVFAHEYQHLLHADQDPSEETWVNEGLSDWTEWLVGYGIPAGHWDTAQEMAENSLVIWGDQGDLEILADYGEAFLFMHYLYTHYGEGVMKALFLSDTQGIAAVNAALTAVKAKTTFADVYHNFAIARLILSDKPGRPKGVYNIPDIPMGVVLRNPDGSINGEAFDTPGAPPWGSDYLLLKDPNKIKKLVFDGLDMLTLESPWTAVDDPLDPAPVPQSVLWSGEGDMQDNWAIFPSTGGGSLTFLTLYDLEENWDYGIVQVSTDNGATWTTLENANTTADPLTNVQAILDNIPGLTGVSGVDLHDPDDPGIPAWLPQSYSLAAFSGPILIGFRWMSDQAANGNGVVDPPNWYVDDVKVDGTLISDGSDSSLFKDITFYQPIDLDFTVDLVTSHKDRHGKITYKVFHIFTGPNRERSRPIEVRDAVKSCDTAVLIVTFDALQGETNYAPYEVKISYKGSHHRPHDPPHRWRLPPRHDNWGQQRAA